MKDLSIVECFSFGWSTFLARKWFYVRAAAIVFAILMAWSWIESVLRTTHAPGISPLLFVVGIIVSVFVDMGQVRFALRAHDAPESVSLRDLWAPAHFWPFLGAGLAAGIFVLFGFILLIIPGLIFSVMVMFSSYVVIDQGRGPIVSLKESARLTKGSRWKLLGFLALIICINILGICALFVGILVTLPVSLIATAHAYRFLQNKAVVSL